MAQSIFDLQAALCQAMGNSSRLRIVHALRQGPQRVGDLAHETELTSSKVSQHLAILRARGVVVAQRQGGEVLYRIANPKIARVCDLMREVLADQASERSELLQELLASQ